MPKDSWSKYLGRWAGGTHRTGRRPGADNPRRRGQEGGEQERFAPSTIVLQEALAQAVIPAEITVALEGYRAAMRALAVRDGAGYQAGMLERTLEGIEQLPLPPSLGASLTVLSELFQESADVIFRGLMIGGKRKALLLCIDGMVDEARIELSILTPLVQMSEPEELVRTPADLRIWLEGTSTTINQIDSVVNFGDLVDAVLGGDTVLLVDGLDRGVSLSTRGWQERAVEEPLTEGIIRGPREGFVESLRTNTMLLRRKLKSPHFKIERLVLGRRTRTVVDLIYLKDVASPGLVKEVRYRLGRIDIDGIIDTGTIEELIEDQPTSVFPQISNTERPDRVAAGLLEGQVAVLADGSPFALLMPVTLWSLLQAGEDYYERFWGATLLRWLRHLLLLVALIGPSFYVAIITFHQEMLPTYLLFSIVTAREGIPFPALMEVLMMEIFFEALREAGVRLPRPVGQAVSIVGALVIGQAAVQAGLVSAPVVIIVAGTGIASFTVPQFSLSIPIRILRFPLIILAGSLGLFGIMLGLIATLIHLCALRSFGLPYLQPVAPVVWQDLKDVLVRAPVWLMGRRPRANAPVNAKRQAAWLKPGPRGDRS